MTRAKAHSKKSSTHSASQAKATPKAKAKSKALERQKTASASPKLVLPTLVNGTNPDAIDIDDDVISQSLESSHSSHNASSCEPEDLVVYEDESMKSHPPPCHFAQNQAQSLLSTKASIDCKNDHYDFSF
jgi:hypothetical protein